MFQTESQDFRQLLKAEFERRARGNKSYSLRAFARDLKLSPQNLSLVLNGKKGLSLDAAAALTERLRLTPEDASYFLDLVQLSHAKTEPARRIALYRLSLQQKVTSTYHSLQEDVFHAISDWYHFGILDLAETSDFQSNERFIATRLGISQHEARSAIERLIRLELLGLDKLGNLYKTKKNITTTHDLPSQAIRTFNEQILKKATAALQEQELDERDFTTMTMAVSITQIPKAKELIRDFRRKMAKLLETGERTEVYTLAVQLFRLSEKKVKRKR